MPLPTSSAAKGYAMLGTEYGTNVGMVQLLPDTAITALPVSLTTPVLAAATQGMRLVIFVYNHTTPGTISIAGTAPNSLGVLSETSTSFAVMEKPGEMAVYVSTNAYGAINASGITLGSGLTGGRITIYGIQAAKRLVPGELKLSDKYKEASPAQMRGIYDRDIDLIPLQKDCSWEVTLEGYPDSGLFGLLGAYNAAPTVATIPASPTVLLAATTAVTGASSSATTQPTAPGMVLQVTIAGGPATAATVTIAGTNVYGEAYTEVVVPSTKANGVWYSTGVFASINASGITYGAFGGGATVAVAGIFGWSNTGNPGDTLNTYVWEQYDGQTNYIAPQALIEEWTIEGGMDKEIKQQLKGKCQEVFPLGDLTTNAAQITPLVQAQDDAEVGWQAYVMIDSISGTAGTTVNADLKDWKIMVHTPWTVKYTSWGNPIPMRTWKNAYRDKRYVEAELTFDVSTATAAAEINAYRKRLKRQVRIVVRGVALGTVAGTTTYKGWQFDLAGRYIDALDRTINPTIGNVEIKLKLLCEWDVALGYSHKITQWTQYPLW